jgi:hypothetical protein
MKEEPAPTCTVAELLAVACPTCGASADAYCEEKPGKVLLLTQHHEERFRLAAKQAGRKLN